MKSVYKIVSISCFVLGIGMLIPGIYLSAKFKSVEIQLGEKVIINDFVRYGTDTNVNADLSKVNTTKVGEYTIKAKYFFVDYDLKLSIVDKKAPELKTANQYKPLNYKMDINDFIVSVKDDSEYKIKYEGNVDTSKYGEYPITIIARDIYNNETKKKCVLSIGWVVKQMSVEVGNDIKISDLVYDINDAGTINLEDVKKVNQSREGIYYIKSIKNDEETEIKIEKTKDVTPPDVTLKDVTIYEDEKVNSVNSFITKVSDKGSKATVKLLSQIDYSKVGSQKVMIEASDEDGNKITKEAKLNIIKDTVGPKISGLSKMNINKGVVADYSKGVSAYDDHFGNSSFDVDYSAVDNTKTGIYYVTYTSSDKLGNKTTAKRVVEVNHDKTDTDNLVREISNKLSRDAEAIRDYVRNNIQYNTNSGGSDPIWYGLKNKVGNCIVHAYIFDALLKSKGYNTMIIWTTDKTHYWNMVYLNNKWVHMDSTPTSRHNKYSIMNDALRYERLQGRDWDRSLWPKAE